MIHLQALTTVSKGEQILGIANSLPDPEFIKLFFMLNSAENEICSAYKKIKYYQFKLSSCTAELSMKIFPANKY